MDLMSHLHSTGHYPVPKSGNLFSVHSALNEAEVDEVPLNFLQMSPLVILSRISLIFIWEASAIGIQCDFDLKRAFWIERASLKFITCE